MAPKKEKLAIAQKSLQETLEILNAKRAELKEVLSLPLALHSYSLYFITGGGPSCFSQAAVSGDDREKRETRTTSRHLCQKAG